MIEWETRVLLKHYLEQGYTKTQLARQFGISRKTIHRWIESGQLDRDLDAGEVRYRPRPSKPTKLDPFKALIRTRLEEFPELTGIRLFREVKAAGYPGGITQLTDFIREVRPRRLPEPVIRFETAPGHQAQVDFAHFRFPWGRRYAFLLVLGYSRLLWLRFVVRQDMRTLFDVLEAAFHTLGGVPREILFDQMRAVVTKDLRLEGGPLVRNAEFLRFAAHWGFTPRACRPYRAQTKGKVERPIRYVRENFVYGRDFAGDADLDAQAEHWLDTVANLRTHGTTKQRPIDRFQREEQSLLLPLASRRYRSLVLLPEHRVQRPQSVGVPGVTVERRPLAQYTALAGGGA